MKLIFQVVRAVFSKQYAEKLAKQNEEYEAKVVALNKEFRKRNPDFDANKALKDIQSFLAS